MSRDTMWKIWLRAFAAISYSKVRHWLRWRRMQEVPREDMRVSREQCTVQYSTRRKRPCLWSVKQPAGWGSSLLYCTLHITVLYCTISTLWLLVGFSKLLPAVEPNMEFCLSRRFALRRPSRSNPRTSRRKLSAQREWNEQLRTRAERKRERLRQTIREYG